tara:strand:- start:1182 stop:2672 length:1491 start_codon:yes stop_codon:yes gene_type:complete
MTKSLIVLITLNLLVTCLFAQNVMINENVKEAYSNILSLRFDEAMKRIQAEKIINPTNVFIPYLENYIDFLKVTISEDEYLFDSIERKVSTRINEVKKLNDTSRFKNYFIGNINLQWATANLKFGNYATGAIKINRAYRLLEENNREFPDFIPNSITLGVLHIMIGLVPDSYSWILDLISIKGTVAQGQKELIKAYEVCQNNPDYDFLEDEILFYMGMVNLNLNPDPEFTDYLISKLKDSYGRNLMNTYLAINAMMKNGRNEEALELFATIDKTINYYPFYYLDYLHGECFLRNLKTSMAVKEYHKFLVNFKGQNYIKDSWQKIAWAELLDNDTASYLKNMQQVLNYGKVNIDADKSAEKAAKNGDIPNIELLKCRLLFDGGYYKEAQKILNAIKDDELSLAEKVEKNYRLGRIAHSLNNWKDAKNYYNLTIETGSVIPQYYAANAALKLGNIYEIEHDSTRATYYYNVCLDLDFNEYRNSIRVKAKQGLKRVNDN